MRSPNVGQPNIRFRKHGGARGRNRTGLRLHVVQVLSPESDARIVVSAERRAKRKGFADVLF